MNRLGTATKPRTPSLAKRATTSSATRGESASEIVRAIEGANRQFALPGRRHDDFTAIVIKVH